MSNLSRWQAAEETRQTLDAAVHPFINVPDEYINYAAAAGLGITRNFPPDHPYPYLTATNASGPQLASVIGWYAGLCSKTLSFHFMRSGNFIATADPGQGDQGQAQYDYQASLPPPGYQSLYFAYYPGAAGGSGGGNGEVFDCVNSFRKVNGPATFSVSGNNVMINDVVPAPGMQSTQFAFEIIDVNRITRCSITYVRYDDWTGFRLNGQAVGAWFDGEYDVTPRYAATTGIPNIVVTPYVYEGSYDHSLKSFIHNGTNVLDFIAINGIDVTRAGATISITETRPIPGLGQIVPDQGYGALLRGNASHSAFFNILLNLNSKLHANMLNTTYYVTYCHTNCHNNCHSSRGRR